VHGRRDGVCVGLGGVLSGVGTGTFGIGGDQPAGMVGIFFIGTG
tara:strand:- start:381 stop:512 length:132 start_codon:yes stop_codon:yes gene_type:complete